MFVISATNTFASFVVVNARLPGKSGWGRRLANGIWCLRLEASIGIVTSNRMFRFWRFLVTVKLRSHSQNSVGKGDEKKKTNVNPHHFRPNVAKTNELL